MSLAADARDAVRARPFLLAALRAGIVNYTAAADLLDLDGDTDAVATALRRYADDLDAWETSACDATVRMRSGVGLVDDVADLDADTEPMLTVSGRAIVPGAGSMTAVTAAGSVGPRALAAVVSRLEAEHVVVDAAGVAGDELVVVVPQRQGAPAVQAVEAALEAVPS